MAKRLNSTTLQLKVSSEDEKHYPQSSRGALAHFWAYPEVLCRLRKEIWQQLRSWDATRVVETPTCPERELEVKLRHIRPSKRPVILFHNALEPLLRLAKLDVFSIRSSHHHDEFSPRELKKLDDLLKRHEKVLWIVEPQLKNQQVLMQKIRRSDAKIEVDLQSPTLTPQGLLDLLITQLEKNL